MATQAERSVVYAAGVAQDVVLRRGRSATEPGVPPSAAGVEM